MEDDAWLMLVLRNSELGRDEPRSLRRNFFSTRTDSSEGTEWGCLGKCVFKRLETGTKCCSQSVQLLLGQDCWEQHQHLRAENRLITSKVNPFCYSSPIYSLFRVHVRMPYNDYISFMLSPKNIQWSFRQMKVFSSTPYGQHKIQLAREFITRYY